MNLSARPVKTPVHLWIVGVISLLWNSMGAYDYSMTQLRNSDYLNQFPPEILPIIDAFPAWAVAGWACGVWGAVAGSILLLLRSKLAVFVFVISLIGLAVSTLYQRTITMPDSVSGPSMVAFQIAIWAVAILLLWYAMRQRNSGVLR